MAADAPGGTAGHRLSQFLDVRVFVASRDGLPYRSNCESERLLRPGAVPDTSASGLAMMPPSAG